DDLDIVGLLKVDCLALGMLTAVRKTLQLLHARGHPRLSMATIPPEDKETYDMICRADTVGVFQIESRAQMAMLPRLQPRKFYDLVIEVAIVRPGPIQGDMVHPYLRRRKGEEPVSYPTPELEEVFKRTLGVPLFQEQVMQVAIVAADFTPGEADALRRSMAAWKRYGGLEPHRERLFKGMLKNGYKLEFAERLFEQIKGFGSYGFPESHAASFALIAYASSWLKCHHPAAFACGLINSQPMGFYTPNQIVQDLRRHGVRVLPVDVRFSEWDCTLESHLSPRGREPALSLSEGRPEGPGEGTSAEGASAVAVASAQPALRLGLRLINGFRQDSAERIVAARTVRTFTDVADLCVRASLDERSRSLLADANALRALTGHRHRARWAVAGIEAPRPLLAGIDSHESAIALPPPSTGEDIQTDYTLTGMTLGRHPLSLLRKALYARRCQRSSQLAAAPHGARVRFAGLITMRQRPQTASGVTFVTLEDEDGLVNAVIWHHLAERQRRELLESRLMAIDGRLERADGVQHLIATRLENLTSLLGSLSTSSRDFR
ncbi:MAG TPA: OB-fold nucleic acid binding domain-containing protein, partial [Lysobacter sp.]|nr:OB-fold nucleic acid binding domain-containing protein [Lysobacter sp.]